MVTVVPTPVRMIEEIASLRLPPKTDRHLQTLMDRNTEGMLTAAEREELEELVAWSESISLLRGQAIQVLGRHP